MFEEWWDRVGKFGLGEEYKRLCMIIWKQGFNAGLLHAAKQDEQDDFLVSAAMHRKAAEEIEHD